MYKMKKGGLVRICSTAAEKKRWEELGYKVIPDSDEKTAADDDGEQADPLAGLSVDELKQHAFDNKIDIGNATSQSGILKKIHEGKPLAQSGD